MLTTSLRALCASTAIVLFLGGIAGLVVATSPWFMAAVIAAAVFAMPAMYGGGKARPDELPKLAEQFHRFRSAMLLCFAGAAGVYALVITLRTKGPLVHRLSTLGVALWLVAFVLLFFVAYYRTRMRTAGEA